MDNEPTCLCGVKIRDGAFVVSIIGIVFAILNGVTILEERVNKFEILLPVVSIIAYGLVIYASKKNQSGGYLFFLIMKGISLILSFIVVVIMGAIMTILAIITATHAHDHSGALIIFIMVVAIVMFILEVYFYFVIWRAYKFTKNFVEGLPNYSTYPNYNA